MHAARRLNQSVSSLLLLLLLSLLPTFRSLSCRCSFLSPSLRSRSRRSLWAVITRRNSKPSNSPFLGCCYFLRFFLLSNGFWPENCPSHSSPGQTTGELRAEKMCSKCLLAIQITRAFDFFFFIWLTSNFLQASEICTNDCVFVERPAQKHIEAIRSCMSLPLGGCNFKPMMKISAIFK